MDDRQGWPVLPDYKDLTRPGLPTEYVLFGIKFTVVDNVPQPEEEYEDLDITKIKELINESLSSFKNLLGTGERSHFERIKAVHLDMNNMINRAKLWEGKVLLRKMKNEKIEWKKKNIAKVKSLF